jgi:DNA-directed RNA polymerase specialized sigma24 family protein
MGYAAAMDMDHTTLLETTEIRATQAARDKLSQYLDMLGTSMGRLDDREAFRRAVVGAIHLLGYTAAEISQEFNCSRMTVHRWVQGEAAPFAGMRRVIFEKLQTETRRRLRAKAA